MNERLAELIGIIMGDGFLSNCQNHYRIGVVGDPTKEIEYFDHIKSLIKSEWAKDVKVFQQERGLRIVVNSKSIFQTLTSQYGLPFGKGKSEKIRIPEKLEKKWSVVKHIIRGLVDTDGSVFTSNKRGAPNYPSIEISTNSNFLAIQLREILISRGFRVANIWKYQSKKSKHPSYKVSLNGYENIEKWLREIGFSNPRKRRIAEQIVKVSNPKPS